MQYLRQSTAFTVTVGPILDSAGAEYTGAVIGDLSIRKHDGSINAMAAAATLTHSANGIYTLVGTTGNSDTLGRLDIHCNKSTYQMPPVKFDVIPPMVYDSFVLGTDRFDVNVTHIADTSQTARDIGASVLLSSGTGTGQISLSSGAVKLGNVAHGGAAASLELGAETPNGGGALFVHSSTGHAAKFQCDFTGGSGLVLQANTSADNALWCSTGKITCENAVNFLSTFTVSGAITATNASNDIRLGSTERSNIGTSVWATTTRILTANTNLSILTAAQIATGVWQDTVAGDFTVSGSIGKSVMNGVTLGTGLTVNAVTGLTASDVAAIKVVTDELADTLEDQGGGTYGFTTAALQAAPSGGSGGGGGGGDRGVTPGTVLNFKFPTVDTTGAPVAPVGLVVKCYKDNSTTESTAGITTTSGFDSVTGLINVSVDTSADGTFYASGSSYTLVVTAGTADGVSLVGYTVGEFWMANSLLATTMTEGYAADGAAPTLQQCLFMIQQMLTEKSISSTTLTVKKLDGTTTAATFTLNSATAPTSITRAS